MASACGHRSPPGEASRYTRMAPKGIQATRYKMRRRFWLRMGCIETSVLDDNPSEDDRALDDQRLWRLRRIGLVAPCFVFHRAKYAGALNLHRPGIGNANLSAAKHRIDLEHSRLASDISMHQIEFETAKHRVDSAPFEVFVINLAVRAGEDEIQIEWVWGRRSVFLVVASSRPGIAPQHGCAYSNDDQRPEDLPTNMRD